MGLSTPGLGSGLDIKAMIEAYVNAEIMPLQTKHQAKVDKAQTELSAVGQVKSYLAAIKDSLANLSDITKLYALNCNISDPTFLSATVTGQASKGTYLVEIQKLAKSQNLASASIPDTTTSIGQGAITISFGTYNGDKTQFTPASGEQPISLTIPPGGGSLTAIRDAINRAKGPVNASIVKDNTGYRLTLTSTRTGVNYAMKINSDISALQYDPTTNSTNLTEKIAAHDSVISLNGLVLTQSTNTIQDAITGVTLNLNQEQEGKIINLNIADNQGQFTTSINDFIKKYNDAITFLSTITGYDAENSKKGVFITDPQFRTLKNDLNTWATSPLKNNKSPIRALADLGITSNKGLLKLDQKKYQAALDKNYANFGALFAKTATTTDGGIAVNSIGANVKAGTYNINISEFSQGSVLKGTIGSYNADSTDGIHLSGTGDIAGLSLNVLSGGTGDRGTVTVQDGLANTLNNFINTYIGSKGDLNQRTDQINKRMKSLSTEQLEINKRLESLTARYSKQFYALDSILAQMKSFSENLSAQINATSSSRSKS